MRRLPVLLVLFALICSIVGVAPIVNGQQPTTTISNLQSPTSAVLQKGAATITVTFTLSYSGLPQDDHPNASFGNYYVLEIFVGTSANFTNGGKAVPGFGTTTPDYCSPGTGDLANTADRFLNDLTSDSGTESASFTITLNSAEQYNLLAAADMFDPSYSTSPLVGIFSMPFQVTVTQPSVFPTLTQPYVYGGIAAAVVVLVLVVLVVRRRAQAPPPPS